MAAVDPYDKKVRPDETYDRVNDLIAQKSDSTELDFIPDRFICGTAGTIKVVTKAGDTMTLTVVAGQEVRLRIRQVWSTGTTVTVAHGLF